MKLPDTQGAIIKIIDKKLEEQHKDDWKVRKYMGISSIGNPCERYIWLQYRKAVEEHIPGRVYRIFDRGHEEEDRIVRYLTLAGVRLSDTGEENQIEVVDGACKGHTDGTVLGGVPEAPNEKMVLEMKSYNADRFKTLEKKGVQESDPVYYCQCQCYMLLRGLDRCLFVAACKNDDSIHVERLKLDKEYARKMLDRANRIATSDRLPPPLSNEPSYYLCKMCPYWTFCNQTGLLDRAICRTCSFVTANADGSWTCGKYQTQIPPENQVETYPCHVLHCDLVPWPVVRERCTSDSICYSIDGVPTVNGPAGRSSLQLLALATACGAMGGHVL